MLDCDIKPILGVPFFASVNPVIDWAKQAVTCRKGWRVVNFEVVPIDDGAHVEEVTLRYYMHGLAKGKYVTSVLCTLEPSKHLASATLGFTHCTAHGELGDGGKYGVYDTEAK